MVIEPYLPLVICVDFDGTCVTHEYPEVGEDVPGCIYVLKALLARGDRLILWTMRSGAHLEDAKKWFEERGIPLFGVNQNPEQRTWSDSPKAYAQVYIDDAALGCPLVPRLGGGRPFVHWGEVANLLGMSVDICRIVEAGVSGSSPLGDRS